MTEDERQILVILQELWSGALDEEKEVDLLATTRKILDITRLAEGYAVMAERHKAMSAPTRIYVDASLTKTCILEEGRVPIVSIHFKDTKSARERGMTVNQMEYHAILKGLRYAKMWRMEHIEILSDSELATMQIDGVYAVKNKKLKLLCEQAWAYKTSFLSCKFTWIPREENLAGLILDGKSI